MTDYKTTLYASVRLLRYLYWKACQDIGYDQLDLKIAYRNDYITKEEHERKSKALSELYVKYICKASNRTLKAVLDCNEVGILRRAPYTLDAIKTELFERALYEKDTGET